MVSSAIKGKAVDYNDLRLALKGVVLLKICTLVIYPMVSALPAAVSPSQFADHNWHDKHRV